MSERYPGIPRGLSRRQEASKRAFDLILAIPGFLITFPLVAAAVIAATIDTGEWGVFSQHRVGRSGILFRVHKVRTMRTSGQHTTTVTTSSDTRITKLGAAMRLLKIDELPQLWNVVTGSMSLVGPRPDVAGWADQLKDDDRVIISVRPGITGPASLAFRREESLLAAAEDPESYNRTEIWPEKVRLNRAYIRDWSLGNDIRTIVETLRVH